MTPGCAGARPAAAPPRAVPAADELVGVAHRHERDVRARRGDPLDRAPSDPVERRAGRERDAGRALERRAVGQRVRVRQPELEEVGAGVDRGERDARSSSRRPGSRRRRTGSGRRDRRAGRASNAAAIRRAPAVSFGRRRRAGRRPRRSRHARATARRRRTARTPRGPCRRGPRSPSRTSDLVRPRAARALGPGQELGQGRDRVRRLERRQDALGPGQRAHRRDGLVVGRGRDLEPAGLARAPRAAARRPGSRGRPRPSAPRSPGRPRPGASSSARRGGCPACRRRARRRAGRSRSPSPAASTTASRTAGSPMNRASSPIAFEPPPTQASARSGSRPSTVDDLGGRLVADPPLEVAHDRRVRVRAHRRAEDVVGRLDVRDPVAHRLVDRVLERRACRTSPVGPRRRAPASGARSGPGARCPRRPCRRRTAGRAARRRSRSRRRAGRRRSRR